MTVKRNELATPSGGQLYFIVLCDPWGGQSEEKD